jgi:hypothetical protein
VSKAPWHVRVSGCDPTARQTGPLGFQAVDNLRRRSRLDKLEEKAQAYQWYITVEESTKLGAGGTAFQAGWASQQPS